MQPRRGTTGQRVWATGFIVAVALAAGCSSSSSKVTVRAVDDVQVMSPDEVRAMKAQSADEAAAAQASGPGDTIPQNEDNRPVELRLFEAFGSFRSCIEDAGETLRGDLTDRNNPAFKDPDYVKTLQKCASRSKIAEVFQEFQSVRSNLTPDQVQERNESFKKLQPCLEKRGWTIETTTSEIGLIQPTQFTDANGELNERDIQQCVTETGIGSDSFES